MSASEWVTKDTLYDAFKEYCVKQCLPVSKPNSFARNLLNQTAFRISSARPEVDGKRITVWQGIKLLVRDVNDVDVSSLSKGHAKEDDKARIGIKLEKNVGNPDAIASITLANPNPDVNNSPNDNVSTPDSGNEIVSGLGVSVEMAFQLWRSEGAPMIHLGPGENCFDLGELLSRPEISPEHLEAVKAWLQEHIK